MTLSIVFSDFVFKIRLIKLGFFPKTQEFLYTKKLSVTLSHAWLILVEFT